MLKDLTLTCHRRPPAALLPIPFRHAEMKSHPGMTSNLGGGLLNKKLIDKKNIDPESQISWPGNPETQSRKDHFLGRKSCSLERGGCTTPSGGLRPLRTPFSRKLVFDFSLRIVERLGPILA